MTPCTGKAAAVFIEEEEQSCPLSYNLPLMDTLSIIDELRRERDRVDAAIVALTGPGRAQSRTRVTRRRRQMSAAARKRISEAAKARWAKAKKAGRTSL